MTDPGLTAALEALRQSARRSTVARRLDADAEQALLQTIVEATVTLFEAEASSIALFERDPDRLEYSEIVSVAAASTPDQPATVTVTPPLARAKLKRERSAP